MSSTVTWLQKCEYTGCRGIPRLWDNPIASLARGLAENGFFANSCIRSVETFSGCASLPVCGSRSFSSSNCAHQDSTNPDGTRARLFSRIFFFKQKTAYEICCAGVQTCALPI